MDLEVSKCLVRGLNGFSALDLANHGRVTDISKFRNLHDFEKRLDLSFLDRNVR